MYKNKDLTIEETFNLAVKNYEENNIEVATNLYKKILEINPSYINAHINLGRISKQLGDLQSAINYFKKVIEIDPNHAITLNNLGAIYYDLGKNKKAKNYYEKAIEIDSSLITAHYNLAVLFKGYGEDQKAISSYKKAIEINPNYALARDNLKILLDKQILLSKIKKAKKSKNRNRISFTKKICKKIFGSDLRLKTNPFISHRAVEEELISCLYKMNNKNFKETNDIFFGDGKHSEDFMIFQKDFSILNKVENELTDIMKQAVKSDIFICDSFFNILRDSNEGGSKWHIHSDNWDTMHGLHHQKYSLTYHVAIGNQKSSKPGFLSFKEPEEEILPSEGMVMIFPADRSHSSVYNGKIDRIMIGVNFYSLI